MCLGICSLVWCLQVLNTVCLVINICKISDVLQHCSAQIGNELHEMLKFLVACFVSVVVMCYKGYVLVVV